MVIYVKRSHQFSAKPLSLCFFFSFLSLSNSFSLGLPLDVSLLPFTFVTGCGGFGIQRDFVSKCMLARHTFSAFPPPFASFSCVCMMKIITHYSLESSIRTQPNVNNSPEKSQFFLSNLFFEAIFSLIVISNVLGIPTRISYEFCVFVCIHMNYLPQLCLYVGFNGTKKLFKNISLAFFLFAGRRKFTKYNKQHLPGPQICKYKFRAKIPF